MISPKVSIIVPVFNQEHYMNQCLESIAVQTFSDFEVIVVDDGSTDSSFAIAEVFSRKDSRFKIIRQDKCGVSAARNHGLQVALGEFVSFVDSDDWILPVYLEALMSYSDNSDHVISGHFEFGDRERTYAFSYSESFDLNEKTGLVLDIGESYNEENTPYLYCWGQLFRRSLLIENSISFNTHLKLGEDTMFVIDYLSLAKRVSKVQGAYYMYRKTDFDFWRKYSMNGSDFANHLQCFRHSIQTYQKHVGCSLPHLMAKNYEVYAMCFRSYLKLCGFFFFRKQRNAFNDGDYSEVVPFISKKNQKFFSASGIVLLFEFIKNKDLVVLRKLYSLFR